MGQADRQESQGSLAGRRTGTEWLTLLACALEIQPLFLVNRSLPHNKLFDWWLHRTCACAQYGLRPSGHVTSVYVRECADCTRNTHARMLAVVIHKLHFFLAFRHLFWLLLLSGTL